MLGKKLIQAAAGNVGAAGGLGIEELFQTWLYTGNSSTQTITNGIDLAGEGGVVWIKCRTTANGHALFTTGLGTAGQRLSSNATSGLQSDNGQFLQSFNANGFQLGNDSFVNATQASGGGTYASWTFRKAPGFFDVVTYTGTGANRTVAHSLGSIPGTIIVKRTDTTGDWQVYHRSLANTEYLVLNSTAAKATDTTRWNSTTPTSSVFSLGTDASVNASGGTYVAYLFAHDEQIFGEGGDQSVIKCGSYTGNGSFIEIDCGWEAQWVLVKRADDTSSWTITDNMRGLTVSGQASYALFPNLTNSEVDGVYYPNSSSKGFTVGDSETGTPGAFNVSGATYIYIAIRRGPMKTPTSGTEVFSANALTTATPTIWTTGFPVDTTINGVRTSGFAGYTYDRLRGPRDLATTNTGTEIDRSSIPTKFDSNTSVSSYFYNLGFPLVAWNFRRAPGFFDVVAYTGTGVARTVNHNLGVVPELIIAKNRSASFQWPVYSSSLGGTQNIQLSSADAAYTDTSVWTGATPTDSVFSVGTNGRTNASGNTYVAYLFATLPGISKVFSFTGNGTSQTIDCGFAAGARFVLLKRTDSTGNWLVADTARGIVSGNDPLLYLNSTAAEITTLDWIDPHSSGFIVNQEATANANVGGATYIGLAIA